MRDRFVVLVAMTLLLAATLACNAFIAPIESPLPPPPRPTAGAGGAIDGAGGTVVATAAPGSPPGLAPTATLPADATLTPQGVVRILVDLNVRAGPGVSFRRVGFMLRDATAVVLDRDPASGWWRIVCPPDAGGRECWVSGGSQYTRLEATALP